MTDVVLFQVSLTSTKPCTGNRRNLMTETYRDTGILKKRTPYSITTEECAVENREERGQFPCGVLVLEK